MEGRPGSFAYIYIYTHNDVHVHVYIYIYKYAQFRAGLCLIHESCPDLGLASEARWHELRGGMGQ